MPSEESQDEDYDETGFRRVFELYDDEWFKELLATITRENVAALVSTLDREKLNLLRDALHGVQLHHEKWGLERSIFFGVYGEPTVEYLRRVKQEETQFQRGVEILTCYFRSRKKPWWKRLFVKSS